MKIKTVISLYLFFCVFSLSAQKSKPRSELEKEKTNTLNEIKETNRLLSENTHTLSNALNRLNLLGQQITLRKKMILLLNNEIISLDEEIGAKEIQIQTLENELETKKQQYALSVRKMYLHKINQNYLLFILSSQNFSQSFHRMTYLRTYSGWQKKQAEDIIEKQRSVHQEKALLIAFRNEKVDLLNKRQSEESQLNKEEESKKAEVQTLEKNKKALSEELAKKEKQANVLDQQIKKIIAEEILKSQEAAKIKSGQKRTAEIKGGYQMTTSERTLSSTFADKKGKLPYPLTGTYKIVGGFGVHQHKELTRIVTNNNGIDIETTSGNEARAVFAGIVSRIFTFQGYSNSILVRHGNYLTLYSNIDQVYVKQGEMVNAGQKLGKIYTDPEKGNSTLLHFEIWKEFTKLNPLPWIK